MFNKTWKANSQLVARCEFKNGEVKFENFINFYKNEEA